MVALELIGLRAEFSYLSSGTLDRRTKRAYTGGYKRRVSDRGELEPVNRQWDG